MDLNLNYDISPSGSTATERLQTMCGGETSLSPTSWHSMEEEE